MNLDIQMGVLIFEEYFYKVFEYVDIVKKEVKK